MGCALHSVQPWRRLVHRNRRYPPRSERPPPISITVNTTQCSARHTATHRHGHSTASYLRVVTADGREETHPLQLGAGGVDPAGLALRRSVGKQPPQLLREWKLKIALQRGRRRDVDRRVPSRPERYTVLSRALHTATGRHCRATASSSGLCARACQLGQLSERHAFCECRGYVQAVEDPILLLGRDAVHQALAPP